MIIIDLMTLKRWS